MPHEPITIKSTFVPHQRFGEPDRVVIQEYIAPADNDNGIAVDLCKDADAQIARELQGYLESSFPATYGWKAFSDIAQKIIGFRLPLLMPQDVWYIINLRTHPDYKPLIVNAAGELLERYRLPRDHFDLGALLTSRETLGALIKPRRKVPD